MVDRWRKPRESYRTIKHDLWNKFPNAEPVVNAKPGAFPSPQFVRRLTYSTHEASGTGVMKRDEA